MSYVMNLSQRPIVVHLISGESVSVNANKMPKIEGGLFSLVDPEDGSIEFLCPTDNLSCVYVLEGEAQK